ncbi:MAG: bifunctional nuclease domain-containing protein [bacterium]
MKTVEIHGVAVDDTQKNFFVLLKEKGKNDQWLPVPTTPREAREIAVAMHETAISPRPMTHDLLTEIIDRLDAQLVEVFIHGAVGDVIMSFVHLLTASGELKKIAASPADALALAVRTGAKISADDRTLIHMDGKQFQEQQNIEKVPELESLKRKLAAAVEVEDYEKAGELRGKIQDQIRLHWEATDLPEGINEELRRAYYGDSEQSVDKDSNSNPQ